MVSDLQTNGGKGGGLLETAERLRFHVQEEGPSVEVGKKKNLR